MQQFIEVKDLIIRLGHLCKRRESSSDRGEVVYLLYECLVDPLGQLSHILSVIYRALQVLYAQLHGREWVFDLVRYLTGHLPPCRFTLALGEFGGTVFQLSYHFIVLSYQRSYFIFALPFYRLIAFIEVEYA